MIKKVERTSITAWSPTDYDQPLLAMGTVAGAMDASFSSQTELEIFDLQLSEPSKNMRKIAGIACNARFNRITWGKGFIAGGKENGELDLWDPRKILKNDPKSLVATSLKHSGPVRGLHFNPTDTHLLASGATDGEILIWDMNQLDSPYAPGTRSQRLEDVTTLVWNKDVPHILASGSSNGYTIIWDLQNRKEIIMMANPGGRRPITSIAWNPDKPTRMVTSSDDDTNPVILEWDLRNASAAVQIFSGHTKGILSMDWCPKDSDLLLSCGKDNRTIVWDTVQGIAIGDLSHSSNWNFDTHWYPRNPDLCVVSSFDGTVSVHSIQGNDQRAVEDIISPKSQVHVIDQVHDHNDPFSQVGVPEHSQDLQQPVFSLQKPPKWLRKPVGAMWGFGSSLVMFDAAHGPSITIKNIPINEEIAFRADQLEFILNENNDETSGEYCEYMANSEFVTDQGDKEIWKFLKTLFSPNMKEELAEFLGVGLSFESEPRLAKLLKKMTHDVESSKEASNASSPKSPQGVASPSGPNSFSLYSSKITEENDIDTLITKSVLMRDFETAVNVCISANRMSDALAIAVSGGPELLARTQNEYFKRNSTKSYSRILQGANSGNLEELIQSCRLDSKNVWKDLISLVCNYSNIEDLTYFLSIIGDKLLSSKDSLKHAASLCFMSAGNFYNVVSTWSEQLSISNSVEDIKILGMMEKLSLLRQAIRFEDSNLSLDQNEKAAQLNQLYEAYVEYAWIAANHGKLEVSWRFLEQVPVDFIPSHCSVDIIELRDLIYTNTGRVLGVTGGQPTFPFKLIDVFDMEAIRMAEELQRKQEEIRIQAEQKKRNMMLRNQGIANSAIHNNPPYGNPPGNAPYPQQGSYYPTSHWNQSYQPSHPDHYTQPEIHPINTANAQFQRKNSDVLLNQTAGVPQTPYIPSQGLAPIRSQAEKVCYENIQKHWTKFSHLSKTPQDRRNLDDGEKKLAVLHDLMSQQRISAQVLNELNQFCAALDHDNFDAAKKIELQLRTRHFNETGSWIVGIKKLVEGLEKGSKPVGILQQPFEPPQINNNNFSTLANGTSSSMLRPRAGSNPQNIGRPSSFVTPAGNQSTFVPPPVLTNTNPQPHSLIVNQPVGPPPIPNMSAIRPPASSQQHPNASTATPSAPPTLTVTTRLPNSYAQSSNSFQQIGSASIMSPSVMPNMKALNLNGFPTNLATQQSFSQTSFNAQPPPSAGIAFGAPPIPYNSSANASNAPQFSFGVPQSTAAPGPPPTFNYGAPTQAPWLGNRPGFQSQPTPQNPSRPPTSGPYGY